MHNERSVQSATEWIRAQESLEKRKQIEKYSRPVDPLNAQELKKQGYQPIDKEGVVYFAKKLSKGLELKRLDDNGREIEHWMGNSDLLETAYDEEGYVVSSTHLKGNGWGSEKILSYTYNDNGEKILSEIVTQHFVGEPAAAWGAGRPIRGKNIGEPVPTYKRK